MKYATKQRIINLAEVLKQAPDAVLLEDDLFWYDHEYLIRLTRHGIAFITTAQNEQDAVDVVIDYIEDHPATYQSLLLSKEDEYNMTEEELQDYWFGGNCGRYLSTTNIQIHRIKTKNTELEQFLETV